MRNKPTTQPMKNWKEVPLPGNMEALEKDNRGLPIPYIVLKDNSGVSHFKINDTKKQAHCEKYGLCGICGNLMRRDTWLIGGPMSAFHPHGAYIDSPMHKECAVYALQVCPYLAITTYNGLKIPIEDIIKKVDYDNGVAYVSHNQSPDRVPFFVLSKIHKYTRTKPEGYIKPQRPYLEVEYWNDGEKLEIPKVMELATRGGIYEMMHPILFPKTT